MPDGRSQRWEKSRVRIQCFYYPGCGAHEVLPARIGQALAEEGASAEVQHRVISGEERAELGISGSPTIWINGADILVATAEGTT